MSAWKDKNRSSYVQAGLHYLRNELNAAQLLKAAAKEVWRAHALKLEAALKAQAVKSDPNIVKAKFQE